MDNKHIVEQERQALPREAILIFGISAIALVLFLFAGTWYLVGFKPAFIAILALCILGTGAWLARGAHHHVHDIKDRKHIRELSSIAIANHHSIEFNPVTRQLRTISPFTIPDGPLTIKDVTIGNASQLAPVLPTAPAFRSLISQIRPGHLFLAQGQEKPIWGDITDLLSTLDVGWPGTGKSTLLRMVCGQVLLIGGKPVVMDPHGSVLDDLGSEFECAESPRDIEQYAHMLDKQLTQRLANRRAGQADFKPLLLLVDEMPLIAEMSPDAPPVIRRIVLEGRKVGMYALVSGQGVPSSILGGTLVRDAMSSRYVFHTTPQQARMAGIENETAKQMMAILETAGPGKAVLSTANRRPEIVAIPDTSVDDILFIVNRKQTGNSNGNSAETVPGAVADDSDDSLFPVSTASDDVSLDDGDDSGNTIRETIKRMRAKGMLHRDIAALVGLSGRKYPMYQAIVKEEGIE